MLRNRLIFEFLTGFFGWGLAVLILSSNSAWATCGSPVKLAFSIASPPPSTATEGTNFTSFKVLSENVGNAQVGCSGLMITLTPFKTSDCSTTPGTGTITNGALADSSGASTFATLHYSAAETIYLLATAPGMTSACSGQVVVSAPVASKVVFTTQPSASTVINTSLAQQPVVTVEAADGSTITSSTAGVTLSAYTDNLCTVAEVGGTLSGSASTISGVATYSGVQFTGVGAVYLKASSGALTPGCSSQAQFTAGALASFKSCRKLTTQGYSVDNSTERALTGSACGANEISLYSSVDGIPTPVCVRVDCGMEPKVCRNVSLSTSQTDYYCASCAGAGCP